MKDGTRELKGICLACGAQFSGQFLKKQRFQICVKCGNTLEVRQDGVIINTPNACFETLIYRYFVEKKDDCYKLWN
jgi:hypothetical protein